MKAFVMLFKGTVKEIVKEKVKGDEEEDQVSALSEDWLHAEFQKWTRIARIGLPAAM